MEDDGGEAKSATKHGGKVVANGSRMVGTKKALILLLGLLVVGCGRTGLGAHEPVNTSKGTPPERDPALLLEQGRAYQQMGDSLRAQQYFAAAIKVGADEGVAFPLLLRACVEQKNYRLAVEYAEAALSRHPKNARLRFLTGALYGTLGDNVRSRERLERAAKELPQDAEVQFYVGVFFRDDAHDVALADKYFRQYLALTPEGNHAEEAKSSLMERVGLLPSDDAGVVSE